ncbi:MAG: PilT/PilU family type 4a pilus ATPase, partial [Candidatus Dormibacteraeota bacterium]|nr:PilT/PilU family type 4a pilus ATPase [Candidatus Dormibacteraeota bacterium]
MIRVDGVLVELGSAPLTAEGIQAAMIELVTKDQLLTLQRERQLDFAISLGKGIRLRANAFFQQDSISLAMRLLPSQIPTMADLNLPEIARGFIDLPQGLILVTGPTGAGKSTTLAAMVGAINNRRSCHIITVEDPIEYVHTKIKAIVDQREVGRDATSFPQALRAVFREDPDVVLIGEMRDLETISSAVSIAETGHLVLATMHTNDSAQAIDRILDVFPGGEQQQIRTQLAASLAGVIYQQLLPAVGGGRVAAFEVLVASSAIRNLIKDGKTNQIRNVLQTSLREGMQTLERSLSDLYKEGLVTLESAWSRSLHPHEIG